jgi:hypothetical protein
VAKTPTQHNRIGDYRGQSIGSLRPKTIAQLRTQTVADVTQHGLMLVPSETTGLLVGKKQRDLADAVPQVTDYGSAPVYKEHTFEFKPTGGMGESVQSSHTDRRYHYAIDCWVCGGLFGQGPKVHTNTVPNSGLIRRFIEAKGTGGVPQLFYLAGQYVYERSDDTPTGQNQRRFRAGQTAMDAARFTGAYASAADGLYVAWSDGLLEECTVNPTTGAATWTPCALPTGFNPSLLVVVGDELWAADMARCHIRKCTNDPKVAGSWSGPILIGNPSTQITAIRQTMNKLLIFKSDGDVFTVDSTGADVDLFPGLTNTIDPDNGRTAWPWMGFMWFRTSRAFWQLDVSSFTLTPSGPGRSLDNLSEVRGPVQAFCGWNSQLAFGVIWNATTQTSYLLTYGTWQPKTSDAGTDYQFVPQWDGAIAHWTGRKATALWVSSVPSEARLYIGFDDGNYDWIKLVPYPLTPDSGAEFNTNPGYIVAPIHHDMFQADNKHFIGFSIFGPYYPTDGQVSIEYRLRGTAGMPWSTPPPNVLGYLGDFLPAGGIYRYDGERQDMALSVAGRAIEVKVIIGSLDPTTTPILEGVGFHERLVPSFRRDFTFTVDARDVVARRDGASARQSGRWMRDLMLQAAAAPGTIVLELPDELIIDCAIFDYSEKMVAHPVMGGQNWAVDCQVTEFGVDTVYGTIGRTRGTRIGDLRGWEIQQLKRF